MINRLASQVAVSVLDNKAILLRVGDTNSHIRVLGSTFPTSKMPALFEDGRRDTQVTLYPEKGKNGLVALCVNVYNQPNGRSKYGNLTYIPAFIEVVWKKKDGVDYPFIDLDKFWFPADRIGQISHNGIDVRLKSGQSFSSYDCDMYNYSKVNGLPLFVPDGGDVLCRYLYGQAHAHEVIHGAVQRKVEENRAQIIERVTTGLDEAVRRILALGQAMDRLEMENLLLREFLTKCSGLYNLLKRKISWWRHDYEDAFIANFEVCRLSIGPKS